MSDTTGTPGDPPRDEVLDQLVTEWLDRGADIEKLQADRDDVAALILDRVPAGGRATLPGFDDVGVRVQAPSRTLDKAAAKALLTPEQYAAACEPVLTAAGVRKACPGWLVDMVITTPATGRPSLRNLGTTQRGQR